MTGKNFRNAGKKTLCLIIAVSLCVGLHLPVFAEEAKETRNVLAAAEEEPLIEEAVKTSASAIERDGESDKKLTVFPGENSGSENRSETDGAGDSAGANEIAGDTESSLGDEEQIKEETADGNLEELDPEEGISAFALTEPEVLVEEVNSLTGEFSLRIRGIRLEKGESILAPTWRDPGQKDIIWSIAEAEGEDYIVKDSAARHGYLTGTYQIHIYKRSDSGAMTFLLNTSVNFTPQAGGIETVKLSGDRVRVTLKDVKSYACVSQIRIAVWSRENGQDDIQWYPITELQKSEVSMEFPLSAHPGTGIFYAHAYAFSKTGDAVCIGITSFEKSEQPPEAPSVAEINVSEPDPNGDFQVTVKGVPTEGLPSVIVPIWSKSDQSDIVWYTAVKSGDSYVVNGNLGNHSLNTGTYHIHVYQRMNSGEMRFFKGTSMNVSTPSVGVFSVNVEGNSFRISAENISSVIGNTEILVPVWSRSDQSDIVWYTAMKEGNAYVVRSDISRHRYNRGTYQAHLYLKDNNRKLYCIGKTSFEIKGVENQVSVSEIDTSAGTFKVTMQMTPVSNLSFVTVAIWSRPNQEDLKWYTAAKQADGIYTAKMNYANHPGNTGNFNVHAYYYDTAGKPNLIGTTTAAMKLTVREFDAEARAVMRKIIYAVETGGQVYGRQRYDDFTEAYTNSSGETAITIGAGQWFATEAKQLLTLIRDQYPSTFVQYDTAGIAADLVNADWKYYGSDGAGHKTILKGSAKAAAIQAIISSPGGIAVQDSLIDQQMSRYVSQAEALGVTDLKAKLFCANIQHLGGYNAMVRVVNYCKNSDVPITMENMWNLMRGNEAGSGNMVGSDKYASRHQKVMEWLNQYL